MRGEVNELFLASGLTVSSLQLDTLLSEEVADVARAYIRIRIAQAVDLPTSADGESWEGDGEEEPQ